MLIAKEKLSRKIFLTSRRKQIYLIIVGQLNITELLYSACYLASFANAEFHRRVLYWQS
ncbi:hypothetical protein O3M35_001593 [Rhynocoris fuscipes]|uniref:Uncharacterized protein n=1 Tax=Rhynocoris fuscipes TaxID=488301 RepID=A0AAW1CRV9_9HEMI